MAKSADPVGQLDTKMGNEAGKDGSLDPMTAAVNRNVSSNGESLTDIRSSFAEEPDTVNMARIFGPSIAGAAVGGAGGAGGGAAGAGAGEAGAGTLMPAAVPELGAANATPGAVTAGSGMGNAVTAGAIGTSGAAGVLPTGGGGGDELPPTNAPAAPPLGGIGDMAAAPTPTAPSAPAPLSTPATPASPTPTATGLQTGGGEAAHSGVPELEVQKTAVKPQASLSDKALKAITDNPLQSASLGLNVAGQIASRSAKKDAASQLEASTATAREASRQLIAQGMAGQVPPAIMAQFDKALEDRVSEIRQRYASMGRDPATDSGAQNDIAKAVAAKNAQVAQYAQSLISQGLQAAGVAAGPQTAAIQAGAAQDKALQDAMAGSLNSMAMIEALKRGQQPQPSSGLKVVGGDQGQLAR